MDSSKTYCCLPHDLIIRKFEAYVNDENGFSLINNYLSNRIRRTKIVLLLVIGMI